MRLESLTELRDRMEKENIKSLVSEVGNYKKNIMMVRPPIKIIDMDSREVLYYAIVKVIDFSKNGEIIDDGLLYYTLLNEDTINDMLKQISESDHANDLSCMYV
jgi:hypothetical protein